MAFHSYGTLDFKLEPNLKVWSDASGLWGCEAYCELDWFQLKWLSRLSPLSIAIMK